jgi:site-specific DNA recombinase
MSVLSKMTKYCCTACKNKIGIETLGAIFSSELKGFVFNPAEIAAHKRQAAIVLTEVTNSVIMHEESIRKVNREVDSMIELFRMQLLSPNDFKDRYAPLSEQLEQLKAELPKLQARRDVLTISMTSQEDVMEESKDLAMRFDDMEEKQKRSIVETIVNRIEVGKDEVEITFLFNPNPKPLEDSASPTRSGLSPSPQSPLGTDRIRATNPSLFDGL